MSGEGVYDFGWAELTSITAYRYNKYTRGMDVDFNDLDILYRDDDGGSYNRFKTFSQELRLQGNAFGNHLDWLVGGYYANEKLQVGTICRYGAHYDRYANCLVAAQFRRRDRAGRRFSRRARRHASTRSLPTRSCRWSARTRPRWPHSRGVPIISRALAS